MNYSTDRSIRENKRSAIIVIIMLICMIALGFVIHILTNAENQRAAEHFKNGGSLVCSRTLIINNTNWKLHQDNLINNNIAGYISIYDCEIKKNERL